MSSISTTEIDEYNKRFEINTVENEIFFNGSVNLRSMSRLTTELVKMEKQFKSVYLHINSSGGGATDSLAVYDLICSMKIPVYTICTGETCSAGTIISMAGKIKYITPNTYMLIHQVTTGKDKYNKLEGTYKTNKMLEKEKKEKEEKQKRIEEQTRIIIENEEREKRDKSNNSEMKPEQKLLQLQYVKPHQEIEDLCAKNDKPDKKDTTINKYDLINIFYDYNVRYKISTHLMDTIKNIYLKHTKINEKDIDTILEEEGVFDAEECIELGLADQIFKREYIINN